MPYTKEQLLNNEFYQNMKLEAIREYEEERSSLLVEFQASASMENPNSQITRIAGPGSPIQSFENPTTGKPIDDPTNWVTISRKRAQYKRGDGLAEVIKRDFTEL